MYVLILQRAHLTHSNSAQHIAGIGPSSTDTDSVAGVRCIYTGRNGGNCRQVAAAAICCHRS